MTHVVCSVQDSEILCLADTRLSQGNSTITDTGGKVFVVPVSAKRYEKGIYVESLSYTLGFAFCGSTLLANNTHAIASNCTQMLRTESSSNSPSVESVANIYTRAAEYVCRDVNSRRVSPVLFQGLIFGFCPINSRYSLFVIEPKVCQESFSVESVELEMKEGSLIAIGSGKDEFIRRMKIPNSAGNSRSIIELFTQVMNEESVSDVGGHPQVAKAQKSGVTIIPVLSQDRENLDKAIMTINGFNISNIKLDEGLTIGYEAMGFGVERVVARSALRKKGIDPDDKPVSKDLQNLASFELALETAVKQSVNLGIDDNFTLAGFDPVQGEWYFYIHCDKCNNDTPVFKDFSEGSSKELFCGNGRISSTCNHCDEKVEKVAASLESMIWR